MFLRNQDGFPSWGRQHSLGVLPTCLLTTYGWCRQWLARILWWLGEKKVLTPETNVLNVHLCRLYTLWKVAAHGDSVSSKVIRLPNLYLPTYLLTSNAVSRLESGWQCLINAFSSDARQYNERNHWPHDVFGPSSKTWHASGTMWWPNVTLLVATYQWVLLTLISLESGMKLQQ